MQPGCCSNCLSFCLQNENLVEAFCSLLEATGYRVMGFSGGFFEPLFPSQKTGYLPLFHSVQRLQNKPVLETQAGYIVIRCYLVFSHILSESNQGQDRNTRLHLPATWRCLSTRPNYGSRALRKGGRIWFYF